MRKKRIAVVLLLLCVCAINACYASDALDDAAVLATPAPTAAPVENTDFTFDITLGYGGLFVLNRWMPVRVTVTNNGPDFDGLIGVNVFETETEYDRYEMSLTLAGGATKTIQLPIKPRTRQDMYAFELLENKKIIAESRLIPDRLLLPETVCVGILSEDPEPLSYMTQRANGLNTLRGETWATVPLSGDSFPETTELMNTFSLLVVDGFDVTALSGAQQNVLMDWLSKGGVVVVSGGAKAALGYPFFQKWTGVSASKIKEVEDITPELTGYITAYGPPLDQKMWINPIPTDDALISTDEDGLIALTEFGDGIIYLSAFDIGGKVFPKWQSASAFWPRLLRTSMASFYAKMLEAKDQYNYGGGNYRIFELIRGAQIPNSESGIPATAALIASIVLCGIGGYFLLKRFDKSEWMWALTPACSVAFALLLLLMSSRSTINLPVALSTSMLTVTGDTTQSKTYISVATPNRSELMVETDQNELPLVVRSDDYFYDRGTTDTTRYRPINLVQRYQYGESPSIGFASNDAWDPKTIEVAQSARDEGIVSGRIWAEEDGVHGEITNQTDCILTDCAVFTSFGYDILGDILPGQRAEVLLQPPEKPVQTSAANFTYEPGVMYALLDDLGAQTPYTRGIYAATASDYIQAMTYDAAKGQYCSLKHEMQNLMIYLFEQPFSLYQNTTDSYFFGFSDELGQVSVKINQEPVARVAHQAVLGYKLPFEPVGPTGVVLYPQGHIQPEVIVDMGDEEKPRLPSQTDGTDMDDNQYYANDAYIRFGSPVALRFVLPGYGGLAIEKLSIGSSYYDSVPDFYLYNHQTEKWDKQRTLSVSFTNDQCQPYIDEEGALYLRYSPTDSTGRYDSMMMPWISLKGRVE